jgi:hypothetical protein
MNIGRKSVKTLARLLAKEWRALENYQRWQLASDVEKLVNAVVARDMAKLPNPLQFTEEEQRLICEALEYRRVHMTGRGAVTKLIMQRCGELRRRILAKAKKGKK